MTSIIAIGGTDPSGGAGLTRDAAMAQSLGCRVKPVVTAVTVQTDAEVRALHPVSASVLLAQLDAALAAPRPAAIKVGMVATEAHFAALAGSLPEDLPVVLDPVLRASSGGALSAEGALHRMLTKVTLLTPNLPECARLTARAEATTEAEIGVQASILLDRGTRAVLIKGGHGQGAQSTDLLFLSGQPAPLRFTAPRLNVTVRGTGCSLATAIACELARGADLASSCARAKVTVTTWLQSFASA